MIKLNNFIKKQYQTYAVIVKPGVHKLEAVLCDGWYLGKFGLDYAAHVYGDTYKLLEMVLSQANGETLTIVSDDSWKAHASSITSDSINIANTGYQDNKEDAASQPRQHLLCYFRYAISQPQCAERSELWYRRYP